MTGAVGSLPLQVTSSVTTDPGSLIALLSSDNPVAFLRGGDGIIGIGEALRLEFSGPTRIVDAAAAWRALVATATVDDAVRLPGSGLVAFGSFAFAAASASPSLLIVPSVIIGRREGVSWVTRVLPLPAGSSSEERMAPRHTSALGDVTPAGTPFSVSLTPGRMSPKAYAAAVSSAVGHIAAGDARKVVVARDLVGSIPAGADLRIPLAKLAATYPDTFTFALDGLIGSSPETLVRVEGSTVSARVLAGTAPRGDAAEGTDDDSARDAIASSPKDLAEHEFARASVMHALTSHATDLSAPPAFPLALPNLWHLASDVTGTLTDGSSSLDLVAALHPTAAVAGAPTDVAVKLIAQLEPFDRGRYAGPVGWVGANGDGEWAVALRCAQVDGTTITAYAGAGIVADSDPAKELAETTLKFRPIAEALG
jgi:menaquinone-specific isochorismate synthase